MLCLTLVTLWTVACQVLTLSMGFPRKEYWSEKLFPSPGDLLNPGIKPRSPTMQADSLPSEAPGKHSGFIGNGQKLEKNSTSTNE